MTAPLLELRGLSVSLGGSSGFLRRKTASIRAVNDIDLQLHEGEIFGVVGESGCGKTTLARTILGLQRETAGEILLRGGNVGGRSPERARLARRDIQYVHQDAAAALDPWWSVGATLEEGLQIHAIGARAGRSGQVDAMLLAVGLDASVRGRYPHELSGGQLRRVALARILLLQPSIVILDEPTAGLDMSVQATVLNLLLELRRRLALTYVFISHDISVVERLADRVAVMYLGRVVETAPTADLFAHPKHPYTQALLASAPRLVVGRRAALPIQGDPPSHARVHVGCAFQERCVHAEARCSVEAPLLRATAPGHLVACHLANSSNPVASSRVGQLMPSHIA